jgi:hypothetical protein
MIPRFVNDKNDINNIQENMKLISALEQYKNIYKGKPHAILTMGSSGVGKSYTLKSYKDYDKYLVIDYDEMMLQLPELLYNQNQDIYDSTIYHRYYGAVSEQVENLFQSIINGPKINLICHSVIPARERIIELYKAGYHVSILYKKDDNMDDILSRRTERMKHTHLYTKEEFVTKKDVEALTKEIENLHIKGIKISDMEKWVKK